MLLYPRQVSDFSYCNQCNDPAIEESTLAKEKKKTTINRSKEIAIEFTA